MEEQHNQQNEDTYAKLEDSAGQSDISRVVGGDVRSARQKFADTIPKKLIYVVTAISVFLVVIYIGAAFLVSQSFSNTYSSKNPGESTDSDLVFLRSLKDEYQLSNTVLRSESENDSGCQSSSFAGTTTTTCLKRLSWSYEGHEIFSDLEKLALDKGLVHNQYYGNAENSKYYYTNLNDIKVCYHFSEVNDKEGNIFVSVVLATEPDDTCNGSTSDITQINDLSNVNLSEYQELEEYNPKFPYSFLFSNLGSNNDENTRLQLADEGWSIHRTTTARHPVFENYQEAEPLLEVYKTNYSSITSDKVFQDDVEYMQDFAIEKGFDYLGIYE